MIRLPWFFQKRTRLADSSNSISFSHRSQLTSSAKSRAFTSLVWRQISSQMLRSHRRICLCHRSHTSVSRDWFFQDPSHLPRPFQNIPGTNLHYFSVNGRLIARKLQVRLTISGKPIHEIDVCTYSLNATLSPVERKRCRAKSFPYHSATTLSQTADLSSSLTRDIPWLMHSPPIT